jgi:hypothetical protein
LSAVAATVRLGNKKSDGAAKGCGAIAKALELPSSRKKISQILEINDKRR